MDDDDDKQHSSVADAGVNVNEVIKGASAKIRLLDAGAVYADIIPTNLTGSITGHDNNNRGTSSGTCGGGEGREFGKRIN